jgi:hypothetical protein
MRFVSIQLASLFLLNYLSFAHVIPNQKGGLPAVTLEKRFKLRGADGAVDAAALRSHLQHAVG